MSANASGSTRCSLTRATWRRLDRDSGPLVVARRGLSANCLEVRREDFHIGTAQPSMIPLSQIVSSVVTQ